MFLNVQLIDSLYSKVIILERKISEDEDIQRLLDPDPYLGYKFEEHMKDEKFPDEPDIR